MSLPDLDKVIQLLDWHNVLDVVLVTLIIYNLLLLIRGTRAVQIIFGILVLVGVYYGARTIDLPALERTLENGFIFLPFAIIVLFQQEIRRALANFWRTPLFDYGNRGTVSTVINDIVLATTTLSERGIGALIVIERHQGLRDYIENGILVDANLSVDLLISLFIPDAPTHDGAVIVQGDRIAAATVFLPLTSSPELSKGFGTRHRAALGITDETDALAVIVSEETSNISVASRGDMIRNLNDNELRNLLYTHLVADDRLPSRARGQAS
ncbi:MAG: diadenylate cyclase CdaA [Acidobacteriota bacterium]